MNRAILYIAIAGTAALALSIVVATGSDTLDANQPYIPDSSLYRKRTVWVPAPTLTANVSHFAYRDVNRNGVLDIGDLPMAAVAVRLTRPNGSQVIRRSNIHGFINFSNVFGDRRADVFMAGEYRMEVVVPPGWQLTSSNASQTVSYVENAESRPGIVALSTPEPLGLVPITTISGRVSGNAAAEQHRPPLDLRLAALGPRGDSVDVAVDSLGRFAFIAERGQWVLRASSKAEGRSGERFVTVRNAPVVVSTVTLGKSLGKGAQEMVVDFENITPLTIGKMPSGVAGLQWVNLVPASNELYGGEGYINTTVSGHYVAYNTSGYPVELTSKAPFDFGGAYFGVAWLNAEGETLEVQAWRGDSLVASDEVLLSALGPVWFDAEYRGITRVRLATRRYWQFVVDDMVIRQQSEGAKPRAQRR